jgi:hypothetical protein
VTAEGVVCAGCERPIRILVPSREVGDDLLFCGATKEEK